MKIKETVDRQCCEYRDLKPYNGIQIKHYPKCLFCIHCGQLWTTVREMMPSGSNEPVLVRLVINDATER